MGIPWVPRQAGDGRLQDPGHRRALSGGAVLALSALRRKGHRGRLLFDTTRTEANKDRFYWHATPLFREGLGIFARADMPNRELVAKDLEGHTVGVTIGYSRNALSMLAAHHFDVVLMDCQMPGMDGYTATRRIRQMPQWQALPVIAMTANAMLGDREKALACDMNDHVAKPIDVEDLYRVLSNWSRPDAGIA